jgi:hypothetical protein
MPYYKINKRGSIHQVTVRNFPERKWRRNANARETSTGFIKFLLSG